MMMMKIDTRNNSCADGSGAKWHSLYLISSASCSMTMLDVEQDIGPLA